MGTENPLEDAREIQEHDFGDPERRNFFVLFGKKAHEGVDGREGKQSGVVFEGILQIGFRGQNPSIIIAEGRSAFFIKGFVHPQTEGGCFRGELFWVVGASEVFVYGAGYVASGVFFGEEVVE